MGGNIHVDIYGCIYMHYSIYKHCTYIIVFMARGREASPSYQAGVALPFYRVGIAHGSPPLLPGSSSSTPSPWLDYSTLPSNLYLAGVALLSPNWQE
jgi:hypothetical protein